MKIRIILAVLAAAIFGLCSFANAHMAEAGARASQAHPASHADVSGQNLRSAALATERPAVAGTATKTRCVKAVSGRVEDTVCMTSEISAAEALYYFQQASNEGQSSKK